MKLSTIIFLGTSLSGVSAIQAPAVTGGEAIVSRVRSQVIPLVNYARDFLKVYGIKLPLGSNPRADRPSMFHSKYDPTKYFKKSDKEANIEDDAEDMDHLDMPYLTLDNWRQVLYSPLVDEQTPDSKLPQEIWMLVTGDKQECSGGRCRGLVEAWGEAHRVLNSKRHRIMRRRTTRPHMTILDCEHERVLCNMLGAHPGSVWAFDMLPPPLTKHIQVYRKDVNATDISADNFVSLIENKDKVTEGLTDAEKKVLGLKEARGMTRVTGASHPFSGWLHKTGLAMPLGYASMVPTWAIVLLLTTLFRLATSGLGRRQTTTDGRPGAATGVKGPAAGLRAVPPSGPRPAAPGVAPVRVVPAGSVPVAATPVGVVPVGTAPVGTAHVSSVHTTGTHSVPPAARAVPTGQSASSSGAKYPPS